MSLWLNDTLSPGLKWHKLWQKETSTNKDSRNSKRPFAGRNQNLKLQPRRPPMRSSSSPSRLAMAWQKCKALHPRILQPQIRFNRLINVSDML